MKKALALVAVAASLSVSGTHKGLLSINGGQTDHETDYAESDEYGGSRQRQFYAVTRYSFAGGEKKWVGLFCNSLVDAVKDDPAAFAKAKKARAFSISNAVLFAPVIPLFFMGIGEMNRSSETESGKHDPSEISTLGIIMTGSAVSLFIASGVMFAISRNEVNVVAETWNSKLKSRFGIRGNGLDKGMDGLGMGLQYSL